MVLWIQWPHCTSDDCSQAKEDGIVMKMVISPMQSSPIQPLTSDLQVASLLFVMLVVQWAKSHILHQPLLCTVTRSASEHKRLGGWWGGKVKFWALWALNLGLLRPFVWCRNFPRSPRGVDTTYGAQNYCITTMFSLYRQSNEKHNVWVVSL